jgi:Kef-type K+ transport system membrane component KefB
VAVYQGARLILALALVLVAGRAGGHFATKIGQPPVLGELSAGLVIGNLTLAGYSGLDYLKTDVSIDMLSRLGVILLLFQVGLESTVAEMRRVGLSACLVAGCGVIGSFVFGWGVARWLLPSAGTYAHVFLGATLTATSVGVTARVLKELGRAQSEEARVILGAAVVDDVIGLMVLAVVGAFIAPANAGGTPSYGAVIVVLLKVGVFLFGALALGMYVSPKLLSFASKFAAVVLLACALAFCFATAWLASLFGLAPIIGAFAAGLVIEEWHYRDFVDRRERTLDDLVEPVASVVVPIFFVVMGLRTDLSVFARPGVLSLAAALIVAAVLGKQLCALGVIGRRVASIDPLAVGFGMMPRGEVQLLFANLGATATMAGRPLMDAGVFSAVVVTVIATTIMTPPALTWSFSRRARAAA